MISKRVDISNEHRSPTHLFAGGKQNTEFGIKMCKYKKSISGSIKNKKRVPQFPTDELEDCTKTQYTINKDCLSSNANGSKFCVMPVS